AFWHEALKEVDGFRVGVVWQGSKVHQGDRVRSVQLSSFAPLAAMPNVCLISLQKDRGIDQLVEASTRGWKAHDFGSRIGASFADTAGLLMNLDLVISVDTAVVHLTGALGLPVWVAIGYAPDWRWLRDREDTPWYPTMRLFRQKAPRTWDV